MFEDIPVLKFYEDAIKTKLSYSEKLLLIDFLEFNTDLTSSMTDIPIDKDDKIV